MTGSALDTTNGVPGPVRRRPVTALLIVLGALGLALVAPGIGYTQPTQNTVVSSSPPDGSVRDASPDEIVITFDQELGSENTVELSCETEQVDLPAPELGDDGFSLSVPVAEPLNSGVCTIRWQVTNTDDAPNGEGIITFSVSNDPASAVSGPDATSEGEGEGDGDGEGGATPDSTTATTSPETADADGATTPDRPVADFSSAGDGQGPVWLGRLLSTLGIATLFGALVLITAAWPEGVEYLVTVKFLRGVWVLALLGTLLFTAAASAAVTDEGLGSGFSPAAWLDLVDAGWAGRAVLLRLVLVVASAWVAFRPDRAIDPATQLAGLGIPALATATIGVSRTVGDLVALGILMGVLHALAMAIWVGGVILLARVVLSGPGEEDLVHAVRGFGRISILAIIVTVVTGVVQMIRLDGGALFDSGHGRVIILKALIVAAMIFVAISARQFVAQRLARVQDMSVPLADRLRRAFGAEAGIGVLTLVLSAWLLALSPPNIDTSPRIDYDFETTITVADADLEVVIKLTDETAGPVGLEVEVESPESGISGLAIVFTAPPNQSLSSITQPIPLSGPGRAVRLEERGLPLSIPGDWEVQVVATVDGVQVTSEPQTVTILPPDGTETTTPVESAPATIVTVPLATEPGEDG